MVRIIPWSLPPVKGGSIGGYTPKVDPTPPTPDPEPPVQYYDFSSAGFTGNCFISCNSTNIPANTPTDITGKGIYGGASITGISAIDLVGVAALSVKVTSECTRSGVTIETDSLVLSLDLLTYVPTFVGGNATVTATSSQSGFTGGQVFGVTGTLTSLVFTFYVFNSNGEVIQQEEVTVVGGE